MMELRYFLLLILIVLGAMVLTATFRRAGERRAERWNQSMRNSYLYKPAPEWTPGEPIVPEEHVPVPSWTAEDVVREMREAKGRQRERAQKMAVKRAHERAKQEAQRRSEVDAALKKAYASLGKYYEEDVWTGW